jgi:hypothetical protein
MFFSIAYGDPNSQKTPDREASLVIGYSSKVFFDVDIKDAQAATKLWMDLLIKNSESPFNKSETVIFHDLTALENGLKSKSVDIVVLFSQEFVEMKNRSILIPDTGLFGGLWEILFCGNPLGGQKRQWDHPGG